MGHAKFAASIVALVITVVASSAWAFCGFYVAGGDAKLFNEATQVVLMRNGDKTALSMQNNYQGPATEFAMVVPVPQVLQKENVKTLEKSSFDKIDRLTAPRLVEYWEQDPCSPIMEYAEGAMMPRSARKKAKGTVKIEAQFKVGEYDIVVLSSDESTALDTWLKQENYNIPDGAEPLFKPYIEGGMYFFVAKVDPSKVKYEDGRAVLSPLRFDYTSEKFQLPIRLGMINSKGEQDLIAYILAKGQRYEVANYPNAFIPTNIEVKNEVREDFGDFYRQLFDRTVEESEGAVATEYSWDASTCDPCPGPTLQQKDFLTFGAEAVGATSNVQRRRRGPGGGWVVTRLHARYEKDDIGEDLVFKEADGIAGGRAWHDPETGALEQGTRPSQQNMFQGRYIIRHEWSGDVDCDDPQYGRWGGPNGSDTPKTGSAPSANTEGRAPALDKKAKLDLASLVKQKIPEVGVVPGDTATDEADKGEDAEPDETGAASPTNTDEAAPEADTNEPKSTCAGCTSGSSPASHSGWLILITGLLLARRRFSR